MGVYIGTSGELKNAYIGEYRVPGENTLAYYPLKGDAKDYSGNGLNASATSGTITYPNNGYLNISNGYIRFPTCIPSSTRTAPLTLSVRIKGITGAIAYNTVFSIGMDGTGGSGWNFRMILYEGSICSTGSGNQDHRTSGSFSLSDNKWHNIILSVNPTSFMNLYDNGTLISSDTINYTLRSPGSLSSIGQCGTGYGEYVSGDFGEIIIENKSRTAEEIAKYYNSAKGNYGL